MENEKPATSRRPIWVPIVHGAQVFLSVVILGLSGYIIHGKYFDTLGYVIFTSLLTWLVVAYLLVTAYISSFAKFTHIFLVIAANAGLILFWLAAMGATARLRASFKYNVTVYGCYDDGSNIDSGTCIVGRSEGLQKRAAVATTGGLAILSAIAGLSALVMLLFIATLVHAILTWKNSRSRVTTEPAQIPPKQEQGEGYQMAAQQPQFTSAPQQQQQQQQYAPPNQPYSPPPQQAYSPPPQQTYSPPPQQAYSPPPQQFSPPPQGYAAPQQGYEQQQQQQQQQYVQPQYTSSPPQGHSELYTPAHHQAELPSPVHK
ncbi:hypothetical protein VTL71DRAFT_14518 [Oculimacula yallundae]|uniref:MARVEL domain-containing protein n=1 Tax=Oculimacula yallundae TaxID=86028 RepID=A0ABR4CJ87_9HELO